MLTVELSSYELLEARKLNEIAIGWPFTKSSFDSASLSRCKRISTLDP